MRVLITGGAGFIGSHVADRLTSDGHEVLLLDALLPAAHGQAAPRAGCPGTSSCTATCATPTCSDGCCPTWTRSATRRRWSGTASTRRTGRTSPRTTTSARRSCSPPCTRPAGSGWCWPGRWSSTARAATTAPSTALVRPGPRAFVDIDAGRYEPTLPGVRARAGARPGPGVRAAGPAQHLRRDEARPGAPGERVGPADRRHRVVAALPQRLRRADAAGHAVRGRRVDLPVRAGARRGTPGDGGRRAAARLRARLATSRRPTRLALVADPDGHRVRRGERLLRRAAHDPRPRDRTGRRDGRPRPAKWSAAPARATSATSSPTRRTPLVRWAFAPRRRSRTGSPRSRPTLSVHPPG